MNLTTWRAPLVLVIIFSLGITLGIWLSQGPYGGLSGQAVAQRERFSEILQVVNQNYVDSVDLAYFTDKAIKNAIEVLDPHTNYYPKQIANWERDRLQGHFEGIGIEFVLLDDTVLVLRTFPQGPAAQASLRAGDRIVGVNGRLFVGKHITQDSVVQTLRGRPGTSVYLDIQRGTQRLDSVLIQRRKVSTTAITAYKLSNQTGYVHMARFSASAYQDFLDAYESLYTQGIERLVLDMRNNAGGFLRGAVEMADYFLPQGQTIVSTYGRKRRKRVYLAQHAPKTLLPVIVLTDSNTASAAEILAAALQDNRRALIVGNRSYGKGLVQEALRLADESELRLTVARYYTPNGRSIQRPYALFRDSITSDSIGGILPDIVVQQSPGPWPCLLKNVTQQAILRTAAQYCVQYPFEAPNAPSAEESVLPQLLNTVAQTCPVVQQNPQAAAFVQARLLQRIAYMQGGSTKAGLVQYNNRSLYVMDSVLEHAFERWESAQVMADSLVQGISTDSDSQ